MVYTYNLHFILKIPTKYLYGKTVFFWRKKNELAKIIVEKNWKKSRWFEKDREKLMRTKEVFYDIGWFWSSEMQRVEF